MKVALAVVGALVMLIVVVNLAWRWISRRRSLPCPSWLSWGLEGRFFSWLYRTESTLDRIGLRPGQRVLEVGPGPGRLLLSAARQVLPGGEVVGLDIQAPMISKLEARARAAGVENLTAIVGDAAEIVAPGEYDVVYLALTMGEIPRHSEFLHNVFSTLKTGGRLSITELFPDPHFLSQKAVRAVVQEAGFRHVETLGSRWFFTSNFIKPLEDGAHDLRSTMGDRRPRQADPTTMRSPAMTDFKYGFKMTLQGVSYADALQRITDELGKEGFGVLTEIDVRKTLKQKLDVDFRPYAILGACNPSLARQALEAEAQIGLLLPCNVVVQEQEDGRVVVSIVDPKTMFTFVDNPAVGPVADEAEQRLRRVIRSLARDAGPIEATRSPGRDE